MSYTREFNRTIKVPSTTTLSYHGSSDPNDKGYIEIVGENNSERVDLNRIGWGGYSFHDEVKENVIVQIDVDTEPFDLSVVDCNNDVNGLTASVGAMNVAQCESIAENSEKVSKSLIEGFFSTVRTDLSAQQAEMGQTIEAKLLLLRSQKATLLEKQTAMSNDYARTTARYQKIFEDLNNELSNRIHEVDQPVFDLVKCVNVQNDRMLRTEMIQTAITMGKECGILQAQIESATVKEHALEAMKQAQDFLSSKAVTESTIHSSCVEGGGEDIYFVPAIFMKTESENQVVEQHCVLPKYYSSKDPLLSERLCKLLENIDFQINGTISERVKSMIQSIISAKLPSDDNHSIRVRNMINNFINK